MRDVIVNSSPLQYLHQLGLLDLLALYYGTVVVPDAVAREISLGAAGGVNVPSVTTLSWIQVEPVTVGLLHPIATSLGPGEREVLGLALAKPDPLVILDDTEARREAQRLSIRFTGVLGILLKAKQAGIVGQLSPLLDELQRHGFYLDAGTRTHVLRLAGETP